MDGFRSKVRQQKHALMAAGSSSPGSNIEFIIDSLETSKGFPRFSAHDLRTLAAVCGNIRLPLDTAAAIETEAEISLLSF